ncbi:MAG: glucoamylase family protein [Steroidobacteraceae bacterium]
MIALLRRIWNFKSATSPWDADVGSDGQLVRAELFSIERLEQHAITLAVAQTVANKRQVRNSLQARLRDNEAALLAAYRAIAGAVGEGHAVTPAAEWLIDNYHLVEAQTRQIKDDLPPPFYRQLPKLASGPFSGYPRVFGLAWNYVAHSDSLFDPETLRRFVRAYQQVQPLTIGELWAVAITLRVVLVENLRRAAERIVGSRIARQQADQVADQLLGVNGHAADPAFIADPGVSIRQHQDDARFFEVFVVQLVKRLRDQDPRVTPALLWLENLLSSRGTSSDAMVRDEHQRQGASNITVRNIITSMRLISDVNWPDFFEDVSLVDAELRAAIVSETSAGSKFSDMDFATRNLYRSAIEELARGSTHTELDVARAVVAAATSHDAAQRQRDAGPHDTALRTPDPRQSDPGYYLLAHGRPAFERAMGYRPPLRHWLSRCNTSIGPGGYISVILLMTCIALAVPMWMMNVRQVIGWQWIAFGLLGLIPAVDLAVALVNRAVTGSFGATMLPGLELRDGIPEKLRTMVVVPTLLTTAEAIQTQIERLEVHYLASSHGALHFALLSDWCDAATETVDDDAELLELASAGIKRLNQLHGPVATGERFYLLHRRRMWSEAQQQWMGWERKRGKLHELNRLLRGALNTSFFGKSAQSLPQDVRFIVTLDADTRLPRESVRRMIGKLAHPLNRPRFDVTAGHVVEGYAVLQPRVTPSLPIGREGSLFQRVFSSMNGIDAYDVAASDVYQDLFGAGSYAGKGIYDIDAFESALSDRVPEGSLLSHDLFEGTFAHAGLVSDVEVVEEFPSRYDVAAARTHRWARGDWQLLPWILGRRDAARRGNGSLPLIGLWKMLDNLRRTLSAPATVVALLAGWVLPMPAALAWTTFLLTAIALPILLPVIAAIVPCRRGVSVRSHLRALGTDLWLALLQMVFVITFLAHQAWLMTDAIGRTLFRLIVSHRNLLEWVTAAQAQLSTRLTLFTVYRRMLASVCIAFMALLLVAWSGHATQWLVLPFVLLWLAAPAIARAISVSPLVAGRLSVSAQDALALRLIARRTWRYFETFTTELDNMLPPDNFQEDPQPVLAHRTSPTNIGLYLLCAVSARDFGWAGIPDIVARLEATLATMHRLAKFRGHFYNWYDTRDLRPLEPRYVSSVDSGNLAAHLIAVAHACREWSGTDVSQTALHTASLVGIEDAMHLLRAALEALPAEHRTQTTTIKHIQNALDTLASELNQVAATPVTAARLGDIAAHATTLADSARALVGERISEQADEKNDAAHSDMLYWAEATLRSIESWQRDVMQPDSVRLVLQQRLLAIATDAHTMALAMEFDFLLDPERKLLSIGYSASDGMLDPNCYDLLASEARLASFFAIAKNDVSTRHWFRLGRSVTAIGHGAALISWSGSMFEYLMPSLVMRAPVGSLLEQTSRLIVRRQIAYGAERGVPWGVSESAFSARDLEFTYQYSNFGVPGLGLKRGLSENLVVAPYATALATMVDPAAAMRNFAQLSAAGAYGRYGFYEALDYTRTRLPAGSRLVIVRAFMAHHQGMTVVAIANVLFDGRMRARFHTEASVQATELLLQERTPRDVSIAHPRAEEVATAARIGSTDLPEVRRLHTPHTATPQTHLLSNGHYSVMLTGAGSGYSRWRELGLTRWREDATRDDTGSYIFLRDVADGTVWSAGYQPSGTEPDRYAVTFTEDRAEFYRCDGTLTTTLHVVVSPEDDAEVRRVSITNSGDAARDIDVTSYSELVLAPPAADHAHPAFSKLFVQTEYVTKLGTLLATRRRRAPDEAQIWIVHHVVVEGEVLGRTEYETDRARFLGRGREVNAAIAVVDGRPLSNTVGTVLDPIFALRKRVRISPGATARLSFWTSVADSRAAALGLFDKHHDANAYMRAATLAWTQAQVQLRHLGVTAEQSNLFQRLAGHVLYASASLRPSSDTIKRGGGTADALWAQGISGDVPIVLLRIDHVEDIDIVRQLLRAHEYWRLKQLAVDLVILNERAPSYVQDLQNTLETVVRMSQSRPAVNAAADNASGSVFVLRTDLISAETRAALSSVARVVLHGQRGTLAEQLERRAETQSAATQVLSNKPHVHDAMPAAMPRDLEFFNGMGGFDANGREYAITLDAEQSTPAPWINVIANPQFGFQVSAEGSGYTWAVNSRENQLTQWGNDPVTDRPGEVLYVSDDDTGELWGPTAAPVRDDAAPYEINHGQGYSRFVYSAHGIELELTMYVPIDDPIKICRLKLCNLSPRIRHLSITAYIEWVLGTMRGASAPTVVTEIDTLTGAMLARNAWNTVYGSRVAFADLAGRQTQWTGDRREFLGRHGRLDRPAALIDPAPLSKRVGAGLDPCAALQAALTLGIDEQTEIVLLLGEAASANDARKLLMRYRTCDLDAVLHTVHDYWDEVLGTVQVKTPDRSMDIMLNRWLLYQTLVCRTWARSAFYQASGAYGFRDQLQDGMALAVSRPAITREHLLRAAGRQFPEGDVQHWWLPPTGQGVRTRIADDRIWLAYACLHYLNVTGDTSILDEKVAFIEGAKLEHGQHDSYFMPAFGDDSATLFEHCARGLDDSLALGAHGLPLIGTGDWNDGMNRVGEQGHGESVWLGWFLHTTLTAFAAVANARNESTRAAQWVLHAADLRASLERESWDGGWYRRGYFDDGTPFGSAGNDECRIDSIAQSWSVLSGAANPDRAAQAMAAVDTQLIRRNDGLALLFTPPFDHTTLDPGYIKGYPPGLRENGGQYTHAATWSVIAFAKLGEGDKAAELFSLLNPINHTSTRTGLRRYKVEPYVVAADVYSVAPHVGRGGWTWYTGAAGWLYRAGLESILGFQQQGDHLLLNPCIPKSWPRVEISFRYRSARYEIMMENPDSVSSGTIRTVLDGVVISGQRIQLHDDGATHQVHVTLGQP